MLIAILAQWQRFAAYFGRIPGSIGRLSYGVCSNVFSGKQGFDYLCGVEVSRNVAAIAFRIIFGDRSQRDDP